jgi:dTMP kinase
MIIAIEGLDGCGKTTVSKLLANMLDGTYLKFPDRTTTSGKVIDKALRYHQDGQPICILPPEAFHALQVVNRVEKHKELWSASAARREHVVCDRYTASGLVYGTQDGLDRKVLEVWNTCLMAPDLNVLLSVDPVCIDGERLRGRDREVYESRGLQGFDDQARRFEALWAEHKEDPRWRVFIGLCWSPADLATAICHVVAELGGLVPVVPDQHNESCDLFQTSPDGGPSVKPCSCRRGGVTRG